jgi:DNA-binding Lrp family transcriptional regulator
MVNSHKLNQKFLYAGRPTRRTLKTGKISDYILDKIDLKIIHILSTNARIKLIDLAKQIKEDPKVVRYHMKKLETARVIFGYFSSLNLELFKRSFIQVDISLKNPDAINSIIEFFDTTNICVFASELLGKYDLTVELYIESDKQMRDILYDFKKKFTKDYIFYDVSRIYREFVVNWSPYDAFTNFKN